MQKLPQVHTDFSELTDLFFGTMASRLMVTAIDMKIFDHLEEPHSSAEIADSLNSDPDNTELVLNALCACGLLNKKNGSYRNSLTVSDFLVCGKPTYLGGWFQQADAEVMPFLDSLVDRIKYGPGDDPEEDDMNSEDYCERYTEAHAVSSLGGVARQIAQEIACLQGFSACRSMLDLGGGPAINAMAVAQENPHLSVKVFDRPAIARIAQTYIERYGFRERVSAIGGDYLRDSLGSAYDLIMITDSLYYDLALIKPVLEKCHQALRPGGVFAAIHAVLTDEGTRPANLVLDLLAETMTSKVRMPEKGFLVEIMEQCGFKQITSKMVNIGGNPMEMNMGRA